MSAVVLNTPLLVAPASFPCLMPPRAPAPSAPSAPAPTPVPSCVPAPSPAPQPVVVKAPANSNNSGNNGASVVPSAAPAPVLAPAPAPAPAKPQFSHDLVKFRCVRSDDRAELEAIARLEAEAFPPEEAEDLAAIIKYAKYADTFFRVATYKEEIVGYIIGTLTHHEEINSEVLKQHEEDGHNLYIHSVVIKKAYRGGGFGRKVLDAYLNYVKECSTMGVTGILLLAKQQLVPFYENAGFNLIGEANVQMGADQWFECRMDLEPMEMN